MKFIQNKDQKSKTEHNKKELGGKTTHSETSLTQHTFQGGTLSSIPNT